MPSLEPDLKAVSCEQSKIIALTLMKESVVLVINIDDVFVLLFKR